MAQADPKETGDKSAEYIRSNIARLSAIREQSRRKRSVEQKASDAITMLAGSMAFVYLHVVWFGVWIAVNVGLLGVEPFDPFPFGLLTMIVSLEAIFLSTFVLISQNRMMAEADDRAELDLEINLLAEHEITRVLRIVDAIGDHLGLAASSDAELEGLERDIEPDALLRQIEERKRSLGMTSAEDD